MQLSSIVQCKTFLANALELLASLMRETPTTCTALTSAQTIDATVDLIAHGGFTVRSKSWRDNAPRWWSFHAHCSY